MSPPAHTDAAYKEESNDVEHELHVNGDKEPILFDEYEAVKDY